MLENLVLEGPYSNKDFFNFSQTSQQPRHRWYYFKEGFSSEVVKEALSANSVKNKRLKVLDVFNGCGTTVLTSALNNHLSVGIEVNPFLEFVTRIKTNDYNWKKSSFNQVINSVISGSRNGAYSPLEGVSTFTKTPELKKWLFNISVIRQYTSIIDELKQVPNVYRPTLKFLALSAIMECCNAKKDGKGLRYKKNWEKLNYSSADFVKSFLDKANMFIDDIEQTSISKIVKPHIYLGDSRKILADSSFEEEDFDLLITSPPYLNSFDYSDIYRAELFVGGFVENNYDLKKIRLKTIRSHVQVDWERDIKFDSAMLKTYFDLLETSTSIWNYRIPLMIKAYFDDIHKVLSSAFARLKTNAELWIVVSTSAYGGIHIPVDLLIADVGSQIGYNLKAIHCLRYLRTSSQQYKALEAKTTPLRESLIIFRKV